MKRKITEKSFCLKTNKTMLYFKKMGDVWTMPYFGAAVKNPSQIDVNIGLQYFDEKTNSFTQWKQSFFNYDCSAGKSTMETYPAYGSNETTYNDTFALQNTNGAIQVVHADGACSIQWKVVGTELSVEKDGSEHLVIKLKDKLYDFYANQHFVTRPGCDVVETWVVLTNKEKGAVRLARMDSFAFEFLGLAKEYYLTSLNGLWGSEANLTESKIGWGQALNLTSHSGIHDAWGNSPFFMVSLGEATETKGRVFGAAFVWSGVWKGTIAHRLNDQLNINIGVDNLSGAYVLDAGESITLPSVVFTYSDEGKGEVSRRFHRWARTYRMPNRNKIRDVLLNSWEGAYFNFNEDTLTDMMDGVKKLGGEMFVIDDGWFGEGKYARNDDTVGLADWCWNFEKLPRGINYLVKEAKKRGLKLGLWFEPEMANTESAFVKAHPDWVLQEKGRTLRQGRGHTQVVLDMTNPEVREAIFKQMCKVIDDANGLSYIKWDANAEVTNPGSTYLPADKQSNFWFEFQNGVYELFSMIRRKYPKIVIQACASGGGRAELGALGYADEFWASDNTDARQRIFIQWGQQQFCPASAMACHVTAVPNHQTHRVTPLKYRFDVAMSGRLGFELHPKNMTDEEVAFAQKAVAEYKKIREVVQHGDLYRLVNPYKNDYASIMYTSEDKKKAVVFVWGMNRLCRTNSPAPLMLDGLDENKVYTIREINKKNEWDKHSPCVDQAVGGDILKKMGMYVQLGADYDSAVFVLEAK